MWADWHACRWRALALEALDALDVALDRPDRDESLVPIAAELHAQLDPELAAAG